MTPELLNNLRWLRKLARITSNENPEEALTRRQCGTCSLLVLRWPELAERAKTFVANKQLFVADRCVPIPNGNGTVAYLSLESPYIVEIKPYDQDALATAFQVGAGPGEPGFLKKARTLSGAVFDWAKAGFPLATQEQIDARLALCKACEFWEPKGYLHMGKCKKCGCSGAKLNLATSTCPEGKWDAVNNS